MRVRRMRPSSEEVWPVWPFQQSLQTRLCTAARCSSIANEKVSGMLTLLVQAVHR